MEDDREGWGKKRRRKKKCNESYNIIKSRKLSSGRKRRKTEEKDTKTDRKEKIDMKIDKTEERDIDNSEAGKEEENFREAQEWQIFTWRESTRV